MIEVRSVTKQFRGVRAVDGLTLSIGPGITGLLGPNGAGKTTLLRMIATVLAPDDGTVVVDGLALDDAHQRVEVRRRLGYVPQEPGFHPGFTAFELVDYFAILKEHTDRRARHDEVRRVLSLVGLDGVRSRKVRALSGGMRRRLAIAQALLGAPRLLVLDEPTAGLDPEQRLRFRELVTSLATDTTVLLSTHQTEDVRALCQRVVVLNDGRACFDGSPDRLAAAAAGRVWSAPERDPSARLAWVQSDGSVRHVGEPPPGALLAEPTIEDAYLLLVGRDLDADAPRRRRWTRQVA